MSEPLHEELDHYGIPFRSTTGELIESFGDAAEGPKFNCPLPMTSEFVDSQAGLLWIRVDERADPSRRCPGLDGEATDFAAVVADFATRFGEPEMEVTTDPTKDSVNRARWTMGARSEIIVTPHSVVTAGAPTSCKLYISHNYVRPKTERETKALASFRRLHDHAAVSFGWTVVDDVKWLMRTEGTTFIELIDPADIGHVLVTEYKEARGNAFSTIGFVTADGEYESLTSSGPGSLSSIAAALASELDIELQTADALST